MTVKTTTRPPTQNPPPPQREDSRLHRMLRRKSTWIIGIPLLLVLALVGGTLGYLQYLNANTPPALSFDDVPTFSVPDGGTVDAGAADAAVVDDVAPEADAAQPGAATSVDDGSAVVTEENADTTDEGTESTDAADTTTANDDTTTEPETTPAEGSAPPPAEPQGSGLDGAWAIGSGSQAGYRIGYSAVGVKGTRVGRGTAVTGQFQLQGTAVQTGSFDVDFREVYCDGGEQCDEHVREMMAVDRFPYETFALTRPIELNRIPDDGEQITATATGELTLRGKTQPVEFQVTARRNAGRIEVLGAIPVNRDDYDIPDSDQPGFTIDKDGLVEFLLLFDHQG